jgi:hypothetical protein
MERIAQNARARCARCPRTLVVGRMKALAAVVVQQRYKTRRVLLEACSACRRRRHAVGARHSAAAAALASPRSSSRCVHRSARDASRIRRQPQGATRADAALCFLLALTVAQMYVPPDAFGGVTPERTMALQMKCVLPILTRPPLLSRHDCAGRFLRMLQVTSC